jgi:hypothetical protein
MGLRLILKKGLFGPFFLVCRLPASYLGHRSRQAL